MARKVRRKKAADGTRKHQRKKAVPAAERSGSTPAKNSIETTNLDTVWSRTGAANVAGVTYQTAVTAYLLVCARSGRLPIQSLIPEGEEDIDCVLNNQSRLLVQCKDRLGSGPVTIAPLVSVIAHASIALRETNRLALVSDVPVGEQLGLSGWERSLSEVLDDARLQVVAEAVAKELNTRSVADAKALLRRVHIVQIPWSVGVQSIQQISTVYHNLSPAVSGLVHARLLADIAEVASEQRRRNRETALVRRPSDIDTLVKKVMETVDVSQLDIAVQEGIVEPLDFMTSTRLSTDQFLAGIDAKPSHIAAGLDLPRQNELQAVLDALLSKSYALIVGPSGAGKSTLLWRCAREMLGNVRPLRVLRVTERDVAALVRYVRLQEPSPESPLLACVDDLGRSHTSNWTSAADLLLEIPGVLLLGAARAEDFRLAMACGRAVIVQPALDRPLAQAISTTLHDRGISTRLDPDEAFTEADGLLMEFLCLLLAGRRLEDVIGAQIEERLVAERKTEREILRYVCVAHVVGLSVPATTLSQLLGDPDDLHESLSRLKEEHVLTTDEHADWIGLHELRSTVIDRQLHKIPPPTSTETVARLLVHLPQSLRHHLIVRYAEHSTSDLNALAEAVGALAYKASNAADAANLFEALAEADAVRYARQCVEFATSIPVPINTYKLIMFALGMRWTGGSLANLDPRFQAFLQNLPPRPQSLRVRAAALATAQLVDLAISASGSDACRLLESLEGAMSLTGTQVESIWGAHLNSSLSTRARLVAALMQGTDLDAQHWEPVFGPLVERVRALAAEQPHALRAYVDSMGADVIVTTELLVPGTGRPSDNVAESNSGEFDAHEQALQCVHIIFNLCPEATIAEILTLDPDGERHCLGDFEPAYMRIPRGNAPRAAETQQNTRVLDSMRRLLAARYWTDRLRQQAEISTSLLQLLPQIPERLLDPHDNLRRRRVWTKEVERLQQAIADLPELPIPDLNRNTKDHAARALGAIISALAQLASQLTTRDKFRLRGIAAQFKGTLPDINAARTVGYPNLVSVGDPLPHALDGLIRTAGELLFLAGNYPENLSAAASMKRVGISWAQIATELIERKKQEIIEDESNILQQAFSDIPDVTIHRLPAEDAKSVRLVTDTWLVVIPVQHWYDGNGKTDVLQSNATRNMEFRTYVLAVNHGLIVPVMGISVGYRTVHPIDGAKVRALAAEAGIPMLSHDNIGISEQFLAAILEISRIHSLQRLRDPSLPTHVAIRDTSEMDTLCHAQELIKAFDDPELQELAADIFNGVLTESRDQALPTLAGELAASIRGSPQSDRAIAVYALIFASALSQT